MSENGVYNYLCTNCSKPLAIYEQHDMNDCFLWLKMQIHELATLVMAHKTEPIETINLREARMFELAREVLGDEYD